jgi:hypothetical protein
MTGIRVGRGFRPSAGLPLGIFGSLNLAGGIGN